MVDPDPSMSFCPREACQAAVPKAVDDEKLRICGSCVRSSLLLSTPTNRLEQGYSYCVFCRRGCSSSLPPPRTKTNPISQGTVPATPVLSPNPPPSSPASYPVLRPNKRRSNCGTGSPISGDWSLSSRRSG